MSEPTTAPTLEATELRKEFQSGRIFTVGRSTRVTAVNGVSFSLRQGEALAIVGESGSGKSTTARMLLGLEKPTSGSVRFKGADIGRMKGKDWRQYRVGVQAVFQDPWSSLNPKRSIGASIEEPLKVLTSLAASERTDRVIEMLELVGLPATARKHYPHEMSGGMRQRVSIARALAPEPACLVLDEPVSALDVSIRAQVMNLLKDLQERLGVAYVLIAHDLATVRFLADRTAVMHSGGFVEFAATEKLFENPLHAYTRELLLSSGPLSASASGAADAATRGATSPGATAEADCVACRAAGADGRVPHTSLVEIESDHLVACGHS